ncbi:hypothetical protein [Sphingomicrobium nitratireducens]|uniref:hypothetical protein n=1 Tax=Sphingomicrobium nitratireducens TaxID=2964666 RepID=UPI00223E9CF7|nr:hypothetical protein [Sphingomicrobium nitratireducens]
MTKFLTLLSGFALCVGGASVAGATPDKPINASMVGSGTGCFTQGANGVELFDPACSTFATVKLDREGNIQHYIYHDSAQLQDGQTAPDSAVVTPVSYVVFGLSCVGNSRITPTGAYTSNQVCTPL